MSVPLLGSVEFVAVAFPTDRIPGGVRNTLVDVLAEGVVTLLDLMVVRKDESGEVEVVEIENLGEIFDVTGLDITHGGLAGLEDAEDVAEGLAPGSCALVLVIEHTWSRRLVGATMEAGAVPLAIERIPAAAVNDLAALLATKNAQGEV